MATPIIIQGVNYKAIDANNLAYAISPFDGNGNLISSVTLSVNAKFGGTTIALPEISTLQNNWNLQIDVVVSGVAGGNTVNNCVIQSSGTDTIGSGTSVVLSGLGQNFTLRPIENGVWSANETL